MLLPLHPLQQANLRYELPVAASLPNAQSVIKLPLLIRCHAPRLLCAKSPATSRFLENTNVPPIGFVSGLMATFSSRVYDQSLQLHRYRRFPEKSFSVGPLQMPIDCAGPSTVQDSHRVRPYSFVK